MARAANACNFDRRLMRPPSSSSKPPNRARVSETLLRGRSRIDGGLGRGRLRRRFACDLLGEMARDLMATLQRAQRRIDRGAFVGVAKPFPQPAAGMEAAERKSTRLNSSHANISY